MGLLFKKEVRLEGIQEEAFAAILIVADIFDKVFRKDCVVTSVTDDTVPPRGEPSLHDDGLAIDFRLNHLDGPATREFAVMLIRKVLNQNAKAQGKVSLYDVVHEFAGQPSEHCHVEFDPHP